MTQHRHSSGSSHHSRRKNRRAALIAVICFAAAFAVLAVVLNMLPNGETKNQKADSQETAQASSAESASEQKTQRDGLETYLIMGFDQESSKKESEGLDGTGQSDFMQVLVLDNEAKTYTILPIDRDTMAETHMYGVYNEDWGTEYEQLALQHSYGTGSEVRAGYVVDAIENYIGQPIDGYVGLYMDCIKTLNSLSNGITVTIEEDFSQTDPTLVEGETVTLTDDQAYNYVHARQNTADGTNQNRMSRQSKYISALKSDYLSQFKERSAFINDVYNSIEPYMVSDMKLDKITNIVSKMATYEEQESPVIEGERIVNEETNCVEFYPDEDSKKAVLEALFQ